MYKSSFISKEFRPNVTGSKLQYPCQNVKEAKYSTEINEECILFISAMDDIVPAIFLRDIEHGDNVIQLFYDELGTHWDFTFSNKTLTIYFENKVVSPISIYHRHPGISLSHPYYQRHMAFFEVIDIWKGNLLGQKRDNYHNFSKGFQGITSIKVSSEQNKGKKGKARFPKSYFVKGMHLVRLENIIKLLIVKSCSNIRSKVVASEIFSTWDFSNLKNLPTLFQEKIIGTDIRVHVCGNDVWPLEIETKDCLDYRYASKGSVKYNEVRLPLYVKNFCKSVASFEKNKFVGLDLMKSDTGYYCFESNPGPGWSTYHHPSKKMFASKVFKQLLRRYI